MALEQRLNLKMQQRLVMTPSLQQAIRLLQLSKLELAEEIAQELVENPVLEEQQADEMPAEASAEEERAADGSAAAEAAEHDPIDEIDIDAYFREPFESSSSLPNMYEERELPSIENAPAGGPDLADHLRWQLGMQLHDPKLIQVGKVIVGNLDEDGYLRATDEEILQSLEEMAEEDADIAAHGPYAAQDVERARRRITWFDPVGVAARTLEECLLIQLEHVGLADSLAARIVREHLDLLRQHKYQEISRALGCEEAEAREAAAVVRDLNPKPGAAFGGQRAVYVVPDVQVVKVDGVYQVLLNDEGLPRLRISPVYRRMLEQARAERSRTGNTTTDRETREYVREKLRSALWFIKSLDQRQQTIYKVAESIVRHQQGFFDHGVAALKPMVLRDVAEDVQMHESTVSRVVTNKYMSTPQGVVEMKFFFHSGLSTGSGEDISSLAVKQKIKRLIEDEPPHRPYSDSALVKVLKGEGIDIARRTVAKYRDELNIPASPMRKRM